MGPKRQTTDLGQIYQLIDGIKKDLELKATTSGLQEVLRSIQEKDEHIELLESKVALMSNVIDKLKSSIDNNEQYSRRTSLRILNIPLPSAEDNEAEEETADVCLQKVRCHC